MRRQLLIKPYLSCMVCSQRCVAESLGCALSSFSRPSGDARWGTQARASAPVYTAKRAAGAPVRSTVSFLWICSDMSASCSERLRGGRG